ncbi:MAG: tRNA uridine-5-carboxymethylaminomethyl(34) synthesis enzyme MnmG [Lachnospiraceae bacterium]|nr:tRNA uridine-5-carboxymethylaminomethyl(34) synthesis enzyme MnmG [Lachnospiraceae bacterium]
MTMDNAVLKNKIHEKVDVCVIGAGHAGCEAALACSRNGLSTVIFTVSVDSIALMPCNPNVGGSSKGHLVRELDALGGEMGRNIDKTFIQSKMLNASKGPAVHSLRAQADKQEYTRAMRRVLEEQDNLVIKQAEVCEIETEDKDGTSIIRGVRTATGAFYECRALIICSGTYLKARCLTGESIVHTGPNGLQPANSLSGSLEEHGVVLRRFKTGTPARMDGRSLDYSKMEPQHGDEKVVPFSFSTDPESVQIKQVDCYLTYTNEETHKIIRANLDRSPIYAGIIEGTGPRYCPSIEDKVVKFADKERHQVFIEPEGLHTNEMYIGGMSSSLPEDVQLEMYRTVPGLERCRMVRNAYAIEYDCLASGQLKLSLELKNIKGVFCAGQFNGSSGYEEAAAQGLMAGINAVRMIEDREPLILDRSEAYIGVLIDDLVTKENREPYRMMTSRAEYRLLLRQDNADLRLRKYGFESGLISAEQYEYTEKKQMIIESEKQRMFDTYVGAARSVCDVLNSLGSADVKKNTSLAELICRPELDYEKVSALDNEREEIYRKFAAEVFGDTEEADSIGEDTDNRTHYDVISAECRDKFFKEVNDQINIEVKYEGYIKRQKQQVEHFKKMETRRIPADIDYDAVTSLRLEARQKLKEFRPENLGQASRISGVSPADVNVLLIYLESRNSAKSNS